METVFTFKKKKLIVVRLKSDETEQSHKHTLKYVLYRKSCLPAKKKKKKSVKSSRYPLKKKSKKLALQLVTLLSSI